MIQDETKDGPPRELWLTWQLFVVFWGLDNWPVILSSSEIPVLGAIIGMFGMGAWFEWVVTHVVLLSAVVLGWVVGLKSVYGEYTPERLLVGRKRGGGGKEK